MRGVRVLLLSCAIVGFIEPQISCVHSVSRKRNCYGEEEGVKSVSLPSWKLLTQPVEGIIPREVPAAAQCN